MLLVLRYWPLAALALLCAVLWAVIRLILRVPVRRVATEAIFAGYMGALVYVVLLLPVGPDEARSVWSAVNLVPARTIVGIVQDHRGMVGWQLVGNVVLFLPIGLLLPLLGRRFRRFAKTVAVGLSVSVGIELIQLAMMLTLISRRSVDVDDVILNVAGACLGYLLWQANSLARPSAQTFASTGRRGVSSPGPPARQAHQADSRAVGGGR